MTLRYVAWDREDEPLMTEKMTHGTRVWQKPYRWDQLERDMECLVQWPDHWKMGRIVGVDLVSDDRKALVRVAGGTMDIELLGALRIPAAKPPTRGERQ